ncbi:outer dense fiber protein 2 isoform X4 [Neopsephotus bourkii]|uniref:outer dense fiber protein 2 isoform X4 n=1 Tax=Neopsephotus bourkii TaxID=309878 RepID=UPI002AA4FA3D|nr:outer dense fiber protein 2 isoform X4 [Neopsephotus bourkii]
MADATESSNFNQGWPLLLSGTEGNVIISSFLIHRFPFIVLPFPICGRRAMKSRSSSPPLHVHVDENTPVHVHIKKGQKTTAAQCQQKHKQKAKGDTVNVCRSVRVKTKAPWIPPGKTSVRESTCKWEGPAHRLEVAPPDSDKMPSMLHLSDLSVDKEDVVCCRMNEYEKKIDSLINAVGMMKEAKLQEKEEHKQLTERLLEEQKEQLNEVTQELVETEHENTLLRRSMERIREEKDLTMLEKKYLQHEKECLMSKLNEAERDASAAARQIRALENTIGRLNIEKHMSSSDINALTRQKELLLQKLTTFEETNQTLRQLLKEQHNKEKDAQKLMVEQKILLKRLADSDAENVQLQMKLQEKEKEMESLANDIQAGKDKAKAVEELSKSMEAMRARLQAQLRGKEAENNRLTVQLRNLGRGEAQHKAEVERIMEQLKEVKQKADRDKGALKKALRAQKERAERSEEYVEQLTAQLTEKDEYVAEALSSLETWRNRHDRAVKDKSDLELEIVTLTSRLADLLEEQATREDKVRDIRDVVLDKVHRQSSETSNLKMENERLKASMAPMEEKLKQSQAEVQQLRMSVKNYEGMIENYKSQILKTQMEAEDAAAKLEMFGKENKALKEEKNNQMDLSYKQLQSRLAELEKLPEILKMKESQIAEYREQLQNSERKNIDLSVQISDLQQQIELQGDKMEMTRERCHSAQEDKKQLTLKVEELERS